MLSRLANAVLPFAGRLSISADRQVEFAPGSILAANHTSLADPALVLAALHELGVRPTVLAAAGLWRVPLLGRVLTRGGHIPVHRNSRSAAHALDGAADALARGQLVLIYGEGGLPRRRDAGEAAPEAFRSGLARLTDRTGAPVIPVGQAGARRIISGTWPKQLAGLATTPLRRPRLHVHVGAPIQLTGNLATRTAAARTAVTTAWSTATAHLSSPTPAPSVHVR